MRKAARAALERALAAFARWYDPTPATSHEQLAEAANRINDELNRKVAARRAELERERQWQEATGTIYAQLSTLCLQFADQHKALQAAIAFREAKPERYLWAFSAFSQIYEGDEHSREYIANIPKLVEERRTYQAQLRAEREAEEAKRYDYAGDLSRLDAIFDDYARGDTTTRDAILNNLYSVSTPRGGSNDVINPITGRWVKQRWQWDPSSFSFGNLKFGGKATLLFPFLKYWVGESFPLLHLAASTPTRLVYYARQGPIEPDKVRPLLPTINSFLGGKWRLEPIDAQQLALVQVVAATAPRLPKVIPLAATLLQPGRIFHGWNLETQEPYYVDLKGMRHSLVCGASWTGKTTGLHAVIASLLRSLGHLEALHLVDYSKRGLEFGAYRGLSPKVHVYHDLAGENGVWAMMAGLEAVMERRYASPTSAAEHRDYIVVIIDEAQAFWAMDTGKDNPHADDVKEFRRRMILLAEQARAVRIKLVLATQQPTTESIPSKVTSNLTSRMIYKLVSPQVAQMLLGQTSQLPRAPQDLATGQYLFIDDSTDNPPLLIQTPYVANGDDPKPTDPRQYLPTGGPS